MLRLLLATIAIAAQPVTFTWPTSIDLQPDGSLLLVENGQHRVVSVDPATGKVTQIAAGLAKPYAVVRAGGKTYVSSGHALILLGTGVIARANDDIGPVAISPQGSIVYTTGTSAWRLVAGKPRTIAKHLIGPHGIVFARDGSVLISDTGHDRVIRIANERTTTLIKTGQPRGIDVGSDGTIYVVEAARKRVSRYSAAGKRLGSVGPVYNDPYDVQAAHDGTVYVIETAEAGTIVKIAPDGTVSTVSA